MLNKTINMQIQNNKKLRKNKTRKNNIRKRTQKNTKRTNKYKSSNKIYYGGEMLKHIMVYYNNNKINNGDDLTYLYNSGTLNTQPTVLLNLDNENIKKNTNKKYLIILHDPDAPNGFDSPQNNENQEYIHWIFLQFSNSNYSNITIKEILPYTPPSPPRGTHNYIFTVYDCSKFLFETYEELEKTYNIYLYNKNNFNSSNQINRSNQTGLIKLLEQFIVSTGNTGRLGNYNTKVEFKFVVNSNKY